MDTLPRDLISGINQLKKAKNAVIMAHFYQEGVIQDIADYVGDSLGLAEKGQSAEAEIILLAGVVFMGETAKILNPDRKVIVPDLAAGCSLADNCPAQEFEEFVKAHPGHTVITYVNSNVKVKALSDILCTSSNAERIVSSVPKETPILFAPDRHLGAYLMKKTGRQMVLWPGSCEVHEAFDAKSIVRLKARHPEAIVVAHPECPEAVLDLAQHIGSTSSLISFVQQSDHKEFIVVTESGIIHQMEKSAPGKTFYPAANNSQTCNCAECPYMRLNTLEKIYLALKNEGPEIHVDEDIRIQALKPLTRMLELS